MAQNTNARPAYYEQLTLDNCATLLINHQAGLFLGVKSIDRQILKNNVIGLAKTAKVFNLPTVLFTSSAQAPNRPTIPEVKELFPDQVELYKYEKPNFKQLYSLNATAGDRYWDFCRLWHSVR